MKIEEELKKIFSEADEKLDKYFSPNGKKIFVVLVCLAIAAIIYLWITFTAPKTQKSAELPAVENVEVGTDEEVSAENEKMQEIEIEDIGQTEEKMVSLSVEDFGRANPFLPSNESFANLRKYGFELMTPPESVPETSEAAKVVETKVSGIMYDPNSPSAILNIEGEDYLVRSGDYINNYKVLSISKDLVTVQLGSNVYKAGVGEVILDGEMNHNNIDNLEHKFGGARK